VAHPLLKKLQHRPGTPVLALWAPDEVAPVLGEWEGEGVTVHRRMRGGAPFVLAFVRSRKEVDERSGRLANALGGDDPVLWVAYPKKSSKRYASDVSRDDSWQALGDLGFEPVRQVAVDDDWSALRFRRTGEIKTLTRSRALSAEGRQRLAARAEDDPAVEAWLDGLPEPQRTTMRTVHALVREAAPELAPSLAGKTVGYGPFHYVYDSGREGDTYRVGLANNAQYVSLYVLGSGERGGYLAEEWAQRLGRASVGKSCIRFTRVDGLDLDALRLLVRAAADQQP
jgi:hypothetical protein